MPKKNYLKEKRRNKWGGGPFNAIPRDFLNSLLLAQLSAHALKLLLDLISQYNGMNNGDLCITWKFMERRGWSGRSMLAKAQSELLECGLLVLTRQGGRHRASLYALSIYSIDECSGKIEELSATKDPVKKWLLHEQRLSNIARSTTGK
jgi:hypothetical protein